MPEKFNLSVIPEVMSEFNSIAEDHPRRRKLVFSAAILLLLELPKEARQYIVGQLAAAEAGAIAVDSIIARAKSGDLRKDSVRSGSDGAPFSIRQRKPNQDPPERGDRPKK